MNGALLEAFRHNNWATKKLLETCRGLTSEQLASSATGTYGDILATFNHIVLAEGGYLRRLADGAPDWVSEDGEGSDLDVLSARVEEMEPLWEKFLSTPVDAEKVFVVDQGLREVYAGIIVAQVLHHGSAHREQICAILTSFGIEPPDVQAWGYAEATGRMWERTAAD